MDKWQIYDELIEGIPAGLTIDECIIGINWSFVRAGAHAGIAMTFRSSCISGLTDGMYTGKSLKDVAAGAKSWNMLQASVGMAAINAFYNTPEKLAETDAGEQETGTGESIFSVPLESVVGKKVTVVGHFPYIEKQLGGVCTLSILERDPDAADYLDSACEYLLPEQDAVFITGMTFTNKTLPRLLELTEKARTVLVGPSAPLTEKLFAHGVDAVAGFYITDVDMARQLVSQGAHREIFRSGRRTVMTHRHYVQKF